MLTSSSTNQPTNEHHLHNSLISLMNDNLTSQTLNSTGLYASTSAVQFALLAQKQQQQRNAALVAQCLIPQHHAGLLLNPQLRPVSITQSPLLSAYNCPMTVQSILPQQTQLPTTIFPTTNPPLVSNYYEGSPLIMAGSSSQIMSLNNTESPESKVDTSLYYNVFVGDLSQEVTHEMLLKAFEKFGPIIEAKVMIDQSSGKSRSFGFVTYWKQEDAEKAINEMNGQMVGKRPVRTNWATRQKGETRIATYEEILKAGDGSNASVYLKNVGELTETDVRENFSKYGSIKQIRLFSSKNYGFVVYETKENAARAIFEMSGHQIKGHTINCSWGRVQEQTPKINPLLISGGLNPAANLVATQLTFPTLLPQLYQPSTLLQHWRV